MNQLRDRIKSKDYSSRLENIEQIVGNIAGKTRILFPKYTNHGVDHLKNVERHANNIIPEDIKEQLCEEEVPDSQSLCIVPWINGTSMF